LRREPWSSDLKHILECGGIARPPHAFVDPEQRLIGFRIERLFGGHDLTPEKPADPARIKIAALERLVTVKVPQRMQEGRIGEL
jgi:hypothetical protein